MEYQMTVGELIEKLKEMPIHLPVWLDERPVREVKKAGMNDVRNVPYQVVIS